MEHGSSKEWKNMTQAFSVDAPTINVTGTSTALSAVAMPGVTGYGDSVQFYNEGPNVVFVALGPTVASTTATLPTGTPARTCMPIAAGAIVIYTRDTNNHLFISTICRAAGTAVLNVSVADGN